MGSIKTGVACIKYLCLMKTGVACIMYLCKSVFRLSYLVHIKAQPVVLQVLMH